MQGVQQKADAPRPSLMAQSYHHCTQLFDQIQSGLNTIKFYNNNSNNNNNNNNHKQSLEQLLWKCRMIREYLTRERIVNNLTVQIYEKSVDIGILAEEWDQVFLCLVGLSENIYPQIQIQSSKQSNRFSSSSGKLIEQFENLKMDISDQSDIEMEFEQIDLLQRRDEIQSLLIFYYLNAPNQVNYLSLNLFLKEIEKQKDIDKKCCDWAKKIMKCILVHDFVGYFRILNSGTYNQQKVLKLQTQYMREKALYITCQAYRRISVQYMLQILKLNCIEDLQLILQKLTELGLATAKTALDNLNLQITQKMFQGLDLCSKDMDQAFFSDMVLIFKQ